MQVLIIDVQESKERASAWANRWAFPFPVLWDADGKVAESYAPADVLPDLARAEVAIAANLIIDKKGKVRFFDLLNTTQFDAKLVRLKARLDDLLGEK